MRRVFVKWVEVCRFGVSNLGLSARCAFLTRFCFGWEGSPSKNRLQIQVVILILTSQLEDLAVLTAGVRNWGGFPLTYRFGETLKLNNS